MVIFSAQETATPQLPDHLTVGPTPPAGDFTFPISKSDATVASDSRPWNLRSKNGSGALDPKERPRFSVALTGDEIAEDIYAVTGSLPRRRPKKRPRVVQQQIAMVFPGLWLKEITLELYKVPEER